MKSSNGFIIGWGFSLAASVGLQGEESSARLRLGAGVGADSCSNMYHHHRRHFTLLGGLGFDYDGTQIEPLR